MPLAGKKTLEDPLKRWMFESVENRIDASVQQYKSGRVGHKRRTVTDNQCQSKRYDTDEEGEKHDEHVLGDAMFSSAKRYLRHTVAAALIVPSRSANDP